MTETKILKGFKPTRIDSDCHGKDWVLAKSIYDKRMKLITQWTVEKEHTFWEVNDTNYIMKILNGEYDE